MCYREKPVGPARYLRCLRGTTSVDLTCLLVSGAIFLQHRAEPDLTWKTRRFVNLGQLGSLTAFNLFARALQRTDTDDAREKLAALAGPGVCCTYFEDRPQIVDDAELAGAVIRRSGILDQDCEARRPTSQKLRWLPPARAFPPACGGTEPALRRSNR